MVPGVFKFTAISTAGKCVPSLETEIQLLIVTALSFAVSFSENVRTKRDATVKLYPGLQDPGVLNAVRVINMYFRSTKDYTTKTATKIISASYRKRKKDFTSLNWPDIIRENMILETEGIRYSYRIEVRNATNIEVCNPFLLVKIGGSVSDFKGLISFGLWCDSMKP